jgi:tetratricopeptide (TPR) repeat protein
MIEARARPTGRAALIGSIALSIALSGCMYVSTDRQINYGLNHYEMGLYDLAIPPLVTAAESMEKSSPPDPRLVDVLLALGDMAVKKDRKDLAADFYMRALNAAETFKPIDNKRLRNALVNSGLFYTYNGRPKDAVPLLERAAAISRELGEPVLYAIDVDNIGAAYQELHQYSQASQYSVKALAIIEPIKTGQYLVRTKGVILHNLAASYVKLNRYKEAEPLFKQSLALLESVPNEVEPWRVRTVRKSYADLLRRTGRIKEANEMERAAEPAPAVQHQLPADATAPRR